MPVKLLVLCVVLAAIGCTEKQQRDPHEQELLPKVLLTAPPSPSHPLDVAFESKLKLLGYDVSAQPAALGRPFTVTWYWQVLEPLDSGYQIFTHLSDGKVNRINLDSDRLLRRVYPEARWKKGDYLRDEQEITLPNDWNSNTAVFFLGCYSGETRMKVTRGKEDGTRRAEALRLNVTGGAETKKPEPSVPFLIARQATGPVKIDGVLSEHDWRSAPTTGALVNTMNSEPGAFEAQVRVLYDADNFYCAFEVSDDFLKSEFRKTDDHLWEQDTVEVMLDPEGDARNYFELQVSPRGVHFDTRYDSPRNPRPFGHVDWDSQVDAKVAVNGTLDDNKADTGYLVELAIPWRAFAVGEPPARRPAGNTWRVNFFVMDAREQGQRAVGWSPPRVGDFHTLGQFGRVVFLDDVGGSQPTAATTTNDAKQPTAREKPGAKEKPAATAKPASEKPSATSPH